MELESIQGVQVMLTLVVDRPLPKLDAIISELRSQRGFLRVLVISSERSPNDIAAALGGLPCGCGEDTSPGS